MWNIFWIGEIFELTVSGKKLNSKHTQKIIFPFFSVHHGFGFHNWIHDFDGCSDWFAADD